MHHRDCNSQPQAVPPQWIIPVVVALLINKLDTPDKISNRSVIIHVALLFIASIAGLLVYRRILIQHA